MPQFPKKPPETRRPRGAVRWILRGIAFVLLAGVVLLSAGLYTGALQERVAQDMAARVTGGYVGLSQPVKVLGDKAVGSLIVGASPTSPPVLQVDGLRATGDPGLLGWPPQVVSAERVSIQLTRDAEGVSNYAYLLGLTEAEGRSSSPLALPSVRVDTLGFFADQGGQTLGVSGLSLRGAWIHAEDFRFTVTGDAVTTQWDMNDARGIAGRTAGPATIEVTRSEAAYDFVGKATLPAFAKVDVRGSMTSTATGWTANLVLGASHLYAAAWDQIPRRLFPVPLHVDLLTLDEGTVEAAWENASLSIPALAFDGLAEGLRVGTEAAPMFSGNLRVSAEGSLLPNESITITAETDGGRELHAWVYPQDEQIRATLDTEGVPRGLWEPLVPETYRAALTLLPNVGDVAVTGETTLKGGAISVDGTLLPALVAGDGAPEISLTLETTEDAVDLSAAWRRGNATPVQARIHADDEGWAVAADLDSENGATQWRAIQGPDALPGIDVGVKGPVGVSSAGGASPVVDLDLSLTMANLPGLSLDGGATGTLKGSGTINPTDAALEKGAFDLTVSDLGTAKLSDLRIAGVDEWRTKVSTTLALDALGSWVAQPGLWGEVAVAGRLETTNGETLRAPVTLEFASLGYDDFATPYGETLVLKGDFNVGLGSGRITGKVLEATVAGATLRAETLGVSDGGVALEMMNLENGLPLLAAMGYIDSGTGTLTAALNRLAFGEAGIALEGNVALEAAEVSAGDGLATLEGLVLEANFAPGEKRLQGSGPVRAAKIVSGGAALTEASATLELAGEDLQFNDFQTRIFDGTVNGTIRVEPFAEGFPVIVEAEVRDIDLDLFTEQMEPPNVTLTGKVNGRVALAMRGGELVDLDIDLTAGNGLTLNRSLVEQILLSQDFSGMTGGKSVEKVIRKVLGDNPQRPFDSAELQLGLVDGRIAGDALLNSEGLNLTVDITADPQAILEALREVR